MAKKEVKKDKKREVKKDSRRENKKKVNTKSFMEKIQSMKY